LLEFKTVDEVLWGVARYAIAKLEYDDCVVYLYDDVEECLVQRAAFGPKNVFEFDIVNKITLKLGEGICGDVAVTGIGEIVNDTSIDYRYVEDDNERLSEITVPIIIDGKVIGIIDSEHRLKNFYGSQDLNVLTAIASMVSTKLGHVFSYEELDRKNKYLEQKVLNKTKKLQDHIDELENSYEEIQQQNLENKTLLNEVHHRVKNNLQIVSSLMNLHAEKCESEKDRTIFMNCKDRIIAMSTIHEQLYKKENLSSISLASYLEEICQSLSIAYNTKGNIKFNLAIQEVSLNLERTVPFGLILNELLVNAIKYAYTNKEGNIDITITEIDHSIKIIVADYGVGFDLNKETDSLGNELVETLIDQLDGVLKIVSNDNGTICTIIFKS
jgi:two-component sensor histidine kinase/putative methionine-R-sulfoxide reductase with GAF domain